MINLSAEQSRFHVVYVFCFLLQLYASHLMDVSTVGYVYSQALAHALLVILVISVSRVRLSLVLCMNRATIDPFHLMKHNHMYHDSFHEHIETCGGFDAMC